MTIFAAAFGSGGRAEPFALATVVRSEPPTSAKPGAKALVRADGAMTGWIGGACAEPVVVREALDALRDGRPRLIASGGRWRVAPGSRGGCGPLRDAVPQRRHPGDLRGAVPAQTTPAARRSLLVVETLAALGRAADYSVETVAADALSDGLGRLSLTARSAVVVATHADSDEDALAKVLGTDACYVSLVANPPPGRGDPRAPGPAGRGRRAREPAQGPCGTRHRRADTPGDRGEHPGRDHPRRGTAARADRVAAAGLEPAAGDGGERIRSAG